MVLAGPLAAAVVPSLAEAGPTDLSPCRGTWTGTGQDPWLDDEPYPIEVTVYGGTEHCASVNYIGLCTAKWVDCEAGENHVSATERLVVRGSCAEGAVTIRCPNPTTLELHWEGEPGVMEATLKRELPAIEGTGGEAGTDPNPGEGTEPVPHPSEAPAPGKPPHKAPPARKAEPRAKTPNDHKERGCGGALWLPLIPLSRVRRRRKDGELDG